MTAEPQPIDISNTPELLRLAEEVQASRQPRVLQRGNQAIAKLIPVDAAPKSRAKKTHKGKALREDDALFNLIGIGKSGVPGGLSERKHEFLWEAHRDHRTKG